MANEWRPTTVGEFCPFSYGKALPERARIPGEFPVISSAGISGSHNEPLVTKAGIVIGRKGTVGSVTLSKTAFWPIDTTFYIADEPQRDLRFTYYLLKALGLDRMNSDSAVPGLNRDYAHARAIAVPELTEQRAIAHILGTLDDKIELNRKQNETLEAMARALFKAWFVDFEPVRAKMEGRWQRGLSLPGLPAHLYDLFPDRLVESELGEIPAGWETKRVSDYLSLAYGKSLPAGKRQKGICPVYGSGGLVGFHNEAMINGPTVIVGRKGTVGSLYWEDRPCFPIDTVFYVQPKVPLSFCYYLLESLPLRDMNTDAAVPGLNRENVYRLEVAAPPRELVSHFAETTSRFRESIAVISKSSEALSQLRDTILPKLISGELRVSKLDI